MCFVSEIEFAQLWKIWCREDYINFSSVILYFRITVHLPYCKPCSWHFEDTFREFTQV